MIKMNKEQQKITSAEAMLSLGETLGKEFAQSPTSVVVNLVGDLGVGKTTFARGVAKALGISEAVTSPSFTLEKVYQGKQKNLHHFDFYRLEDPGIMQESLLEAMHAPENVVLIEWGESVKAILPAKSWQIEIRYQDEKTRSVTITPPKQSGKKVRLKKGQ